MTTLAASRATPVRTTLLGALALTCLAAVGAALVSQHFFDMQPCPWCVFQRLLFVAVAAVCVLGLMWHNRTGGRVVMALLLALAAAGAGSALWQHFVAASTDSCKLTLAERIMAATGLDGLFPEIFQARASCADAAVNLFGVPYEFYSLALFVVVALVALRLLRGPRASAF
jgi:protein dithiol:quinone oxidoreductase